jgi:hypothetical protein
MRDAHGQRKCGKHLNELGFKEKGMMEMEVERRFGDDEIGSWRMV